MKNNTANAKIYFLHPVKRSRMPLQDTLGRSGNASGAGWHWEASGAPLIIGRRTAEKRSGGLLCGGRRDT